MKEFIFVKTRFKLLNVVHSMISSDIAGHSHSKDSFELHYTEKGKGKLNISKKSYDLSKGDFYVTGPNTWHQQLTDDNDPLYEYCIYFQLEEEPKDIISQIFVSHEFFYGKDNEIIKSAFENIIKNINSNNAFEQYEQLIYVQIIMNELSKIYSPSVIINMDNFTPDDRKYIIIEDAFLYDYKKVSLSLLSERLAVSERQTQRLIKKYYGKTFSQKKTEARMEQAKLLLEQNKRIADISKEIGYKDVSAFEKAYKKTYCKTPKEK